MLHAGNFDHPPPPPGIHALKKSSGIIGLNCSYPKKTSQLYLSKIKDLFVIFKSVSTSMCINGVNDGVFVIFETAVLARIPSGQLSLLVATFQHKRADQQHPRNADHCNQHQSNLNCRLQNNQNAQYIDFLQSSLLLISKHCYCECKIFY